jgi:photosystem II stability/assembly factor-like uncharacterized protein
MKRLILAPVVFGLAFSIGILTVFLSTPVPEKTVVSEKPKTFEVFLKRIDFAYLSMFDAVYLDEQTIFLHSWDGMMISYDGGQTWQRLFEPTGVPGATGGYTIQNLEFLNSKTGWASGTCLISTHDGGLTWANIKLPEWMDNIKVKFLNEDVGYVAGRAGFCDRDRDRCNTRMSVYKTTDGGKSWRKSYSDRKYSVPWDIKILDESVALIQANGNDVLRTDDGGQSWTKVYGREYGGAKSIGSAPDGRLWIFGNKSIFISDDLGRTWLPADNVDETVVNHDWSSVDFTKEGLGVAVSEDAAIAVTRDGGQSWRQVASNLHVNGKMPVPDNPFDETLRGLKLHGNHGIIMGGQREYLIKICDPDP